MSGPGGSGAQSRLDGGITPSEGVHCEWVRCHTDRGMPRIRESVCAGGTSTGGRLWVAAKELGISRQGLAKLMTRLALRREG